MQNPTSTLQSGIIFPHLLIKIPLIITSSPGFTLSTKFPSKITGKVLGMVPGFKVLNVSCILIS